MLSIRAELKKGKSTAISGISAAPAISRWTTPQVCTDRTSDMRKLRQQISPSDMGEKR